MTVEEKDRPRSILICSMRLIGDVILTTPLIGLLKSAYPDAAIDFLVTRKTGEFLEKDPRVRRVIYHQQFDVDRNVHIKGEGYFRQIARQYDMAINMNRSDRGNFAVVLAGKRWRVGFYDESGFVKDFWKKLLLTHLIKFEPYVHIAYMCRMVADAVGIAAERLECKVFWDADDEHMVEFRVPAKEKGLRYFVIHPFARARYKYWRFERFVEVSDRIATQYGLQPVWTSSPLPDEVDLLERLAAQCKYRPITVPGTFNLNQMTCLLAGASLYVGLDTAITHLAATTGIPMVALFGSTPTVYWAPWDNTVPADEQRSIAKGKRPSNHIEIIQKEWECVPCSFQGCNGNGEESPCLLEIGSDEVLRAVERLL